MRLGRSEESKFLLGQWIAAMYVYRSKYSICGDDGIFKGFEGVQVLRREEFIGDEHYGSGDGL